MKLKFLKIKEPIIKNYIRLLLPIVLTFNFVSCKTLLKNKKIEQPLPIRQSVSTIPEGNTKESYVSKVCRKIETDRNRAVADEERFFSDMIKVANNRKQAENDYTRSKLTIDLMKTLSNSKNYTVYNAEAAYNKKIKAARELSKSYTDKAKIS